MSMPNIPNITPVIDLDRCEVIDLLLSSIALEEIGLSHILNAEGEKLQAFLKLKPCCPEDFYKINESVHRTLRSIVKSQMLLQFKLEDTIMLDAGQCGKSDNKCTCHTDKCHDCYKSCSCQHARHNDSCTNKA